MKRCFQNDLTRFNSMQSVLSIVREGSWSLGGQVLQRQVVSCLTDHFPLLALQK